MGVYLREIGSDIVSKMMFLKKSMEYFKYECCNEFNQNAKTSESVFCISYVMGTVYRTERTSVCTAAGTVLLRADGSTQLCPWNHMACCCLVPAALGHHRMMFVCLLCVSEHIWKCASTLFWQWFISVLTNMCTLYVCFASAHCLSNAQRERGKRAIISYKCKDCLKICVSKMTYSLKCRLKTFKRENSADMIL